jgi:hypothetical protein
VDPGVNPAKSTFAVTPPMVSTALPVVRRSASTWAAAGRRAKIFELK